MACALPIEGQTEGAKALTNYLDTEIPTCRLTDEVAEVSECLKGAGPAYCPVVNENYIVLGLFRITSAALDNDRAVETVMEAGPTTFRANSSVDQAAAYLSKNDLSEVLVTTSDGKLLGVLTRHMAEHAVHEAGPRK